MHRHGECSCARRPVEGRALRRMVLHSGRDHANLLPAQPPRGSAETREHDVLPERGGLPAGRVPGLQALPSGTPVPARRVEPASPPRRPRDAADRRRGRGPRGCSGSAGRLGYSIRQVERQLLAELGAGPLALAGRSVPRLPRLLIETTTLPIRCVAFVVSFSSIRTFNDTVREVFALAPAASCATGCRRSAPLRHRAS